MAVIELVSVTKTFPRRARRQLLRSHIQDWFGRVHRERFTALKNVSFRINAGESVAVIGANGAGKSTLLSLIAGLTEPDKGTVYVGGRVAALLELGSGFHSELTGRENVRLNASLLGLSQKTLERKFDDIIDFSGIGDFIDEPLRTYSTGMILRLAFSVAINVDPDILIVDEVLAVGDQNFQAKCFQKVQEFQSSGKTLLCVSHVIGAVQQFCGRALWLDQGELVMDGLAEDVVAAYNGHSRAASG
jgi:ABC-type polysaccharide/polyol phosphate transport system ATPase subunit